jgi:hypothetical protein
MLPFGNSIAGQSVRSPVGSTTNTTAEIKAGAKLLTVNNAAAFSIGDKVAVGLCYGGSHLTTVEAVDTAATPDTITLARPLPRLARAGAAVQRYVTDRPGNVRRPCGPLAAALAQLGMPVELLPGYGYGGSLDLSIVADLPPFLAFYRPAFVVFNLYENSIPAGATYDNLMRITRVAAESCLQSGALPIFMSCMPNNSINSAGPSAVYDQIKNVINNMDSFIPGARGVNVSDLWLDKSLPNARQPLAGWTDGVHPSTNRYQTIGEYLVAALADLVGYRSTHADIAIQFIDMFGTSGTASGLVGGSTVSSGGTLTAQAGVTAVAYKSGDDKQMIEFSVPGASNVGSTQLIYQSANFTYPASYGGQHVIGFIRFRVFGAVNLDMFQLSLNFSDNTSTTTNQDSGNAADPAYIGKEITLETAAVRIPNNATSWFLYFAIRPQTLSSPSGVAGSIKIIECGVTLAALGEISEHSDLL